MPTVILLWVKRLRGYSDFDIFFRNQLFLERVKVQMITRRVSQTSISDPGVMLSL